MNAAHRELCLRCRRPADVCWCDRLVRCETGTRVVILQHPREARMPVGTARMAHLSLPNSELHGGVEFGGHPRIGTLAHEPGTWLLFPGEGAASPEALDPSEIRNLFVIDGTWPQARKVLKQNPLLQRLPRLGLAPRRPGNYRIRKEPTADSLATIEAVVEVLGVLERDHVRFDAMLDAFDWMVDRQIERTAAGTSPPRHKRPRQRPELLENKLFSRSAGLVALHVEVNAHARDSGVEGTPELLHVHARRLATGETFDAVLAPRRLLAASAPHHLSLSASEIHSGLSVETARERFAAFLRPDDALCTWGPFPIQQLRRESFPIPSTFDLRLVVARRKQSSPGTPQQAAQGFGVPATVTDGPRATRTVNALADVVHGLETTRRIRPA